MPTVTTLEPHAVAVMLLTVVALFLFSRDRIPIETTSLLILVALVVGFEIFPLGNGAASGAGRVCLRVWTRSAGDHLCAHGRGAGARVHRSARADCACDGKRLGVLPTALPAGGPLSDRQPERVYEQHADRRHVLAPFDRHRRAYQDARIGRLDAGRVCNADRRQRDDHRHLDKLACRISGRGPGTTPLFHVRFHLAGVDRRWRWHLYLWLLAPRLLPSRVAPLSDTSPRLYNAVLYVNAQSYPVAKTLSQVLAKTDRKMKVERIERGEELELVKLPTVVLKEGDRLHIRDTRENLKEYERLLGATLYNVFDVDHPISDEHPLSAQDQQLAEVVVTQTSLLNYRSLRQARFAERFKLVTLAIHRAHVSVQSRNLNDIALRPGDVLLVQGASEQIEDLKRNGQLLVLDGTVKLPHTSKAPLALGIFAVVVLSAAFGLLPIMVSALLGTVLVVLTRLCQLA